MIWAAKPQKGRNYPQLLSQFIETSPLHIRTLLTVRTRCGIQLQSMSAVQRRENCRIMPKAVVVVVLRLIAGQIM